MILHNNVTNKATTKLIKRYTTANGESASLDENFELGISQLKKSLPTFGTSHSMNVIKGYVTGCVY
jgi:hypothetical protein